MRELPETDSRTGSRVDLEHRRTASRHRAPPQPCKESRRVGMAGEDHRVRHLGGSPIAAVAGGRREVQENVQMVLPEPRKPQSVTMGICFKDHLIAPRSLRSIPPRLPVRTRWPPELSRCLQPRAGEMREPAAWIVRTNTTPRRETYAARRARPRHPKRSWCRTSRRRGCQRPDGGRSLRPARSPQTVERPYSSGE